MNLLEFVWICLSKFQIWILKGIGFLKLLDSMLHRRLWQVHLHASALLWCLVLYWTGGTFFELSFSRSFFCRNTMYEKPWLAVMLDTNILRIGKQAYQQPRQPTKIKAFLPIHLLTKLDTSLFFACFSFASHHVLDLNNDSQLMSLFGKLQVPEDCLYGHMTPASAAFMIQVLLSSWETQVIPAWKLSRAPCSAYFFFVLGAVYLQNPGRSCSDFLEVRLLHGFLCFWCEGLSEANSIKSQDG